MKSIKTLKNGYIYYVHKNYSTNQGRDDRSVLIDEAMVNGRSHSIYDVDAYEIRMEDLLSPEDSSKIEYGIERFLPEGEYYRYDKTSERIVDRFVNVTEEIIQRFDDYYRNRDESYLKSYIDTIDDEKRLNYFLGRLYNAKDVHSYHVNVGHGNCTFIVFKINDECQMWAVDCSVIDFLKRNNNAQYVLNVDKCLADIKAQYHIDEISVLMVTHLHYDHINGIDYLIRNGYINSNTKVWMNILYPCKMATYNKFSLSCFL